MRTDTRALKPPPPYFFTPCLLCVCFSVQGPGAYDLSTLSLSTTASAKVPQPNGTSSFLDTSGRSSLVKPPVEGRQPVPTPGLLAARGTRSFP
jgi:hypothetical protein